MKSGLSIVVGLFALVVIVLLWRASAKAKAARQQQQNQLDAILGQN